MKSESILSIIKEIPLFQGLSEETYSYLKSNAKVIAHKPKSLVFMEGDDLSGFYVITDGTIKLVIENSNHKEIVLSFLFPFNSFGLLEAIYDYKAIFSAITMTETELIFIPQKNLNILLKDNVQLLKNVNREFALYLQRRQRMIKALNIVGAEKKVARTIIYFAEEYGTYKKETVEIKSLPSQTELAQFTGTSRETISRTLNALQRKKIIVLGRSSLLIYNYEKFKKMFEV